MLVFLLIGELMIRFDEHFLILETNRVVTIPTDIEITPEYQMLKNNNFEINENDLRVMVIGDSYIHGGGIEFKNNFSQQLKKLYENKGKGSFDNIWILDVSKSNSNNFDNNQTYFNFVDKFKPNVVILGYNLNDIRGNLDKQKKLTGLTDFKRVKSSGGEAQSFIKKVYNVLYTSHLIRFVLLQGI